MTRTKLEQAIQQLALVEKELMSIPGVNAVDVGYKYVNGVVTDEICIRVHVKKKKKKVPKRSGSLMKSTASKPTSSKPTTDFFEMTLS